jgi:hypothetical protein
VREACLLHRLADTSIAYWQGWNRLRANIGDKFRAVFKAVSQAMARTPRSSSLVENLNSRLRNYFTLRRHLGSPYLDLLRFFLNCRSVVNSALIYSRCKLRVSSLRSAVTALKVRDEIVSILGASAEFQRCVSLPGAGSLDGGT